MSKIKDNIKDLCFGIIDSTSTYLKEKYKELDNLTFCSAYLQTKGHGRNNREWFNRDNEQLMFSVLVKDEQIIEKYSSLSLAMAVAVYKALLRLNVKDVSLKWPNDVYANNKKICGILLESVSTTKIDALIIGVGLNVNSTFKGDLHFTATSILKETGIEYSIEEVKEVVYEEVLKMLEEIKTKTTYLQIFRDHHILNRKQVYATIDNHKRLVKVLDINDDNSLKVELDGHTQNLISNEVTFHRI